MDEEEQYIEGLARHLYNRRVSHLFADPAHPDWEFRWMTNPELRMEWVLEAKYVLDWIDHNERVKS